MRFKFTARPYAVDWVFNVRTNDDCLKRLLIKTNSPDILLRVIMISQITV